MRFSIVQLTVPAGASGVVTAVNSVGNSCGYVVAKGSIPYSRIWGPDGSVLSAGTDLETQSSVAWDINFHSQIVGSLIGPGEGLGYDFPLRDEIDPDSEAFYFALTPPPRGQLINLTQTFLESGDGSLAGGINDAGLIVGTMSQAAGGRALTYGAGCMPLLPGVVSSLAMRVNQSGLSVGYCNNSRIFTHDQSSGMLKEILSPSPQGFEFEVLPYIDINDRGQISATIFSTQGTIIPAVYDPRGSPPGFSLIPALPNSTSGFAYGLNDSGDVVGTWYTGNGTVAFVKFGASTTTDDLNSLIPSDSGWVLESADDIADVIPFIVGQGKLNGQDSPFLLIPVPEPPNYNCGQIQAELRLLAHKLTVLFEKVPQTSAIQIEERNIQFQIDSLSSFYIQHCDVPPPPGPRPK